MSAHTKVVHTLRQFNLILLLKVNKETTGFCPFSVCYNVLTSVTRTSVQMSSTHVALLHQGLELEKWEPPLSLSMPPLQLGTLCNIQEFHLILPNTISISAAFNICYSQPPASCPSPWPCKTPFTPKKTQYFSPPEIFLLIQDSFICIHYYMWTTSILCPKTPVGHTHKILLSRILQVDSL